MANIYDNTFTLGNTSATTLSAQPGIKITTDQPGVIGIGTDETVLWSADYNTATTGISFSEPLSSFERVKVCWNHMNGTTIEWSEYAPESTQWWHLQGRQNGGGTFTASTIGGGGTHENRMLSLQVCRWIRTA